MKILSFEEYKNNGKIAYVETTAGGRDDSAQSAEKIEAELDSMSYIMEMSTDELMGELTLIMHTGQGLRQIPEREIFKELTQRMVAMEYFLMLYAKNKINK